MIGIALRSVTNLSHTHNSMRIAATVIVAQTPVAIRTGMRALLASVIISGTRTANAIGNLANRIGNRHPASGSM